MTVSLCCMQQCDQLSYAQAIFRLLELSLLDVTASAVTMQEQRQLMATAACQRLFLFTSWHLLLEFLAGILGLYMQG